MSKSQTQKPKPTIGIFPPFKEYIVVTDIDSLVVKSASYPECVKFANEIRKCGGEVTIFKATKG